MIRQFHFLVFFWKIEETLVTKDVCAPLFTAALFTIANIWKEPQCPWIGESKRKKWYTHTHTHNGILFSSKMNEIVSLSITWMDLEGMMPSEARHTEKDKYHTVLFICGMSEIKWENTGSKTETESEAQRTNCSLPEEEWVGRCVK